MIKALAASAFVSAVCMTTAASAAPLVDLIDPLAAINIQASVTQDPCPSGFTCGAGSLSFVHDLEFNPATSVLTGATLTIILAEQVTTGVNLEQFAITFGSAAGGCAAGNCVPNGGYTFSEAVALGDLHPNGTLSVTISALAGHFLFSQSTLTAEIAPRDDLVDANELEAAAVPLPSTLALLGLGLTGIGWRLRRRG